MGLPTEWGGYRGGQPSIWVAMVTPVYSIDPSLHDYSMQGRIIQAHICRLHICLLIIYDHPLSMVL